MPDVLIRKGDLDTQRGTRDVCTHRKNHVSTQQEGGHLQVKERGLRRNQSCQHIDHKLPASRSMKKIN